MHVCLQWNAFPEEFWYVPFIRGLEMSVFVRLLLIHPRSMWTAVSFSLLGHQSFGTRSFVDISEMIWLSLEIDVFVGFCKELDKYVWCVLITAKGEPSPCRIWSFSFWRYGTRINRWIGQLNKQYCTIYILLMEEIHHLRLVVYPTH